MGYKSLVNAIGNGLKMLCKQYESFVLVSVVLHNNDQTIYLNKPGLPVLHDVVNNELGHQGFGDCVLTVRRVVHLEAVQVILL